MKNNFKNLSQEYDYNVLDLVKQKGYFPYEYIRNFEKFKEEAPSKKKIYSTKLRGRKLVSKNMNMFLRFGTNFK